MLVVMFFLNVALGVCFAFYLIFSAIFYPERLLEPIEKKGNGLANPGGVGFDHCDHCWSLLTRS